MGRDFTGEGVVSESIGRESTTVITGLKGTHIPYAQLRSHDTQVTLA